MVMVNLVILNLVVVLDFSEAISRDLLEHSTPDRIQDALKNNWTNTALLAALLFTIAATYPFPHGPSF